MFIQTAPLKKDLYILLLFALFAALFNFAVWRGRSPYVFLSSDAANIAGFTAALDHPGSFAGDEVLDDRANFRHYATIHIPLIRLVARITKGYGPAFLSLLGLHVLVQAAGFYLLGKTVFQNRFWALLLGFASLPIVWLNLGEFWGIVDSPIPRVTFQAILPYILAAAYRWRDRPSRWPLLMTAAGVLIYVHPVSAPAWGFSLWLSLWFFHPIRWPWKRRILVMGILGIIFILVTIPFLLNYLSSHEQGRTASYEMIYRIMEFRFVPGILDIPEAILSFLRYISLQLRAVLLLCLLSIVVVFRCDPEDRKGFSLIGVWLLGLLFVSVIIPWGEQAIARSLEATPVEVDLIRGVRYIVPLMILISLWTLNMISKNISKSITVHIIGLALLVGLIFANGFSLGDRSISLRNWNKEDLFTPQPIDQETVAVLDSISRSTPPGARILATSLTLEIRYYCLRPVIYSWKDGGILAYANYEGLLDWYDRTLKYNTIMSNGGAENKIKGLLSFAEEYGADYVLIDFDVPSSQLRSLPLLPIYSGRYFKLFRIEAPA
jgi:hypothetical protein